MTTGHDAISRWIFDEYRPDARALAIYRIIFALSLLLLQDWQPLWIRSFPNSFYVPPPSFAVLFRGLPPSWFFSALTALISITTVSLLVGWHTRLVSLALAAMLVVSNTFSYSLGKINHDFLMIAVLPVLAFSAWGDRYSVDALRGRHASKVAEGWPLSLLALLIGLAMFSAALPKVTSGWLDLSSEAVRSHLIHMHYVKERPTWLAGVMLSVDSHVFWKLLDWSTVFIEAALLPACFSRVAMRALCAVAVLFHMVIHFSMGIFFLSNLIAYAAFVEWERLLSMSPVHTGLRHVEAVLQRVRGWQVIVIGLALALMSELAANRAVPRLTILYSYHSELSWTRDSILAVVAVGLAVAYLSGHFIGRWRPAVVPTSLSKSDGFPSPRGPVVLFDGVCGLCNAWIDFIIGRDRRGHFRFATLQSQIGQAILQQHGLPKDYLDSIVLIQGNHVKLRSAATLEILRQVDGLSRMLYVLILVPPLIREAVYEFVAAQRFLQFGRLETCRVPSPDERARFLS